jgi:flagellar protein FliS
VLAAFLARQRRLWRLPAVKKLRTADKLFGETIMWNSGHDAYLESRVLAADPVELVNLLYQACIQAVREARCYLAAGKIAERSREINKACAIVIELATSLDHERGGDISQRLALLYDYMQRRLLQANMQQSDAPLEDVLGLLTTLSEAWAGVGKLEPKPAAESPRSQPAPENPKPQPVADSRWTQSAPESSQPQPVADNRWSQSTESAWSQPAMDNRWSQSAPESPKPQPVADDRWSQSTESAWSQPSVDSRWSQAAPDSANSQPQASPQPQPVAESPWSQPPVEADDYRLRAFSF